MALGERDLVSAPLAKATGFSVDEGMALGERDLFRPEFDSS